MDRLKRSLSFRKKKEHVPESSKPHQWQEDERKVREGTCSFQVRYLGCIEVFESRGMQVCEEAVKALKNKHGRGLWARMSLRKKRSKKKDSQEDKEDGTSDEQCKGKYQRAILYVSGDALRVVDEISKGLIVDQTIEKVSFCAPDRNHDKGFAYICRDGTTRRWMCHGFLALKESGERLSHAVGCAFAICLEKKQKREKEAVTVSYNDKGTCFTRTGSFRQASLTERLADPQSTIVAEQVPIREVTNPYAVQRPHATQDMLVRQGSFRGFSKLETSPFKRQLSLRLNELPSTLDRQQELSGNTNGIHHNGPYPRTDKKISVRPTARPSTGADKQQPIRFNIKEQQPMRSLNSAATQIQPEQYTASPIPEASPTKENPDSISEMCQQLTQGLSALTSTESFSNTAPQNVPRPEPLSAPPTQLQTSGYTATVQGRSIPLPDPIRQNNPWAATTSATQRVTAPAPAPAPPTRDRIPSDAELWLNTTASVVAPTPPPSDPYAFQRMTNGAQPQYGAVPGYSQPPGVLTQQRPHLAQVRSHSIDTADMWSARQAGPSLRQLAQHSETSQFQAQQIHQHNGIGGQWSATQSPPIPPRSSASPAMSSGLDPFDAAWAASRSSNPFQGGDNVTKTFQVNL